MAVRDQTICFFIASLNNAGGTERVCTAIANKLSALGYNVSILTLYSGQPFFELRPSIKLAYVYERKIFSKLLIPATVLGIRQRVMQIDPQTLVNVDAALFAYSKLALMGTKVKNVVWEHFHYNAARSSLARRISRQLAAKHAHAIVTLTQTDKEAWLNNLKCKGLLLTINNPAPIVNIKEPHSKQNIVLSVGRLTEQKGFDRLVTAWQLLSKQHPDWQLHIVGSGELKQQLEQQINTLEIADQVKLIPATKQVHAHFEKAAIYCLASRYEGFPMVLLEAQAYGLPVVSFDCETGPADLLTHNTDGLLIENGDIVGLANGLKSLMQHELTRQTMARNAKVNAEKYHIDVIIKHWQQLLA